VYVLVIMIPVQLTVHVKVYVLVIMIRHVHRTVHQTVMITNGVVVIPIQHVIVKVIVLVMYNAHLIVVHAILKVADAKVRRPVIVMPLDVLKLIVLVMGIQQYEKMLNSKNYYYIY